MKTKTNSKRERRSKTARRVSCILTVFLLVVSLTLIGAISAFAAEIPASIVLKTQGKGELTISNRWTTAVVISQAGFSDVTIEKEESLTREVSANQTLTVKESSPGNTFRGWRGYLYKGFVSGVNCAITSMPPMSAFTADKAGTDAGDHFFSYFNSNGSLTSLPAGSFDISSITRAGWECFTGFNSEGTLKSLPAGSFDTSNITSVFHFFFASFNYSGSLTSLPTGSFDISSVTNDVQCCFFGHFNHSGSLTSLPAGSFNTSNITAAADRFFRSFNNSGSLTSLPLGSFDTSNMTEPGYDFFTNFNSYGSLASLPSSFKLPRSLESVPDRFCYGMFESSAMSQGDKQVPLYFAADAESAFSGTDVTPISPSAGTTVYVNGPNLPKYTITFNPQGGTVTPTSKTYEKDSSLGTLPTPTRSGHIFKGWWTTTSGGMQATTTTKVTSSITYYARWAAIPPKVYYIITFNSQGGTVSPKSIKFEANTTFGTLPVPVKSGYIFVSWNSKPDGTGTPYYASTSVNANVTAYAIWRKLSSEKDILSFILTGVSGTIGGTNVSVTVPHGTSITSATPSIAYSENATITPQGAQNFTSPVKYTVSAEDGTTKVYTVTVKVEAAPITPPKADTKVKVTKVSLATTPPIYMVKNKTLTLKASVQPYNATTKKLTFKSLSPKIVKVDKNTGKMKALKTGKARIVVTSQDGKKRAACTIIVVAKTQKVKALKSFSPLTLTVGKTKQIKAKVTPAKATGVMPTYSSSNKKVATIDKAGVITAHKKGTAIITVKVGGKTKTFKATVR